MTASRDQLPQPRDRVAVGALRTSPLCLGIVSDPRVIPAAFEAGINFFFVTADMHWPRYDAIRRGLADLLAVPGRRDDIVVAAVSYPTQPEFCTMPFEELLEEVPALGRLDVVVAGGAYGRELETRLPVYREHRRVARFGAQAIGASFHDRVACADTLARGELDLAFARYNAGHPGAQQDIFPRLAATHAPLYTFKSTSAWVSPERAATLSLPPGTWLPDITDHYRYALSAPAVDGLLIALRAVDEVQALADALAAGGLDADEQDHLQYLAGLGRGTHRLVDAPG